MATPTTVNHVSRLSRLTGVSRDAAAMAGIIPPPSDRRLNLGRTMSDVPEVVGVRCTHCGAPLQLPAGARFVTCGHCGSELQVVRSGNAIYTEVLGRIADSTKRMEQDIHVIRQQTEIETLDREWEERRQRLLMRDDKGNVSIPSRAGGFAGIAIVTIFGTLWTVFATSLTGGFGVFPLFGIFFIVVGVVASISQFGKAGVYEQAEADYRKRRAELLKQLNDPAQQ